MVWSQFTLAYNGVVPGANVSLEAQLKRSFGCLKAMLVSTVGSGLSGPGSISEVFLKSSAHAKS